MRLGYGGSADRLRLDCGRRPKGPFAARCARPDAPRRPRTERYDALGYGSVNVAVSEHGAFE